MKNIYVLVVAAFIGITSEMNAQGSLRSSEEVAGFNNIPQETMFVHYNSSLLFAGEYLYYKLYCKNSETNRMSSISKIGYIEMIGEDKSVVFKHKVKLLDGLGQGDYFIPTTIPSGNYKILGYTNWMKNEGKNYFFQADVSVVNPYRGNQEVIFASQEEYQTQVVPSESNSSNTAGYQLTTDAKTYGKREKVSLSFNNNKGVEGYGTYSLSVRKVEPIIHHNKISSAHYNALYSNGGTEKGTINRAVYLPELRGELISGQVMDKVSGQAVAGKKVAISIPGTDFIFKSANTNKDGRFYFSLNSDYENDKAIVQVLGADRDNYKIALTPDSSVDTSGLEFNSFKITKEMKDMIVQRSIYNQIENGYYGVKPDTIRPAVIEKPFYYGDLATTYVLDEYTRFPTMDEVFVEIIEWVGVRKDENKLNVFEVKGWDVNDESDALPLVIVDGILIQDHEHLLEFNAKKVETISILRDTYFYGTKVYQGIIVVETKDGDYTNRLYGDYLVDVELFKPQTSKNYYKQTYADNEKEASKRIPDFRDQLLWEPAVVVGSKSKTFEFFTSDNVGNYEISLEGFTQTGEPVSVKYQIKVVD